MKKDDVNRKGTRMANKLKHLRNRLNQLSIYTYALLRGALLLSCTMAICALILLLTDGGPHIGSFDARDLADELIRMSAIALLLSVIAAVIVEDLTARK